MSDIHSFFKPRVSNKKKKRIVSNDKNENKIVKKKQRLTKINNNNNNNNENNNKDVNKSNDIVDNNNNNNNDMLSDNNSNDNNNYSVEWGNTKYNPIKSVTWKKGKAIPFLDLCKMLEKVEATSKRLEMIAMLADFFRSILIHSPHETLIPTIYILSNQIAPAYVGVELGIGEGVILKALADVTGNRLSNIKKKFQKTGDLGEVAMLFKNSQRLMFQPAPLTINGVFKTFKQIATIQGKKSTGKKTDLIKKMLVACRGSESKYLARSLQGKLRIGLQEKTVAAALARAIVLTPLSSLPNIHKNDEKKNETKMNVDNDEAEEAAEEEEVVDKKTRKEKKLILDIRKVKSANTVENLLEEATNQVKQAYIEVPNHDIVVGNILKYGYEDLDKYCYLTPGIPVKAMLGKPCKGLDEVFVKFGSSKFTLEFKYDGERAQIHFLPNGKIEIFSRNQECYTTKYPDIIKKLSKYFNSDVTKSFIIDCEVVAYDPVKKCILPFQRLSTRKRKDVKDGEVDVQVCLFAFDMMFCNGNSLMRKSFRERRDMLHQHFNAVEGEFHFAHAKDTSDKDEIKEFLEQSVDGSCEGLMVKALDDDAQYVPAKRNWLKIKKDYIAGLTDSFDLVPLGAYYGKGKRTGVYGAYLLGCYDSENEEFQSITKLGTGFSDEQLQSHTDSLKKAVVDHKPSEYRIPEKLEPDVYFAPENSQVWEIAAADLSVSPVHLAAVGLYHESKGIALRFPRFLRIRDDKKPYDATDASQIVEMYVAQSTVHKH